MPVALVKSASGTSTLATVSPAFATATTAGNLIVLAISGDNITSGVGSGWTQSANMSQVGNNGGYLWWRISTGETTVASYSLASAANSTWVLAEFSGCAATPYDVSLGQHRESSNNAYTTPALTPTTGNRVLVAAMLGSSSSVLTGPFTSWLNSFTAIAGTGQSGSGTKTCGALAYLLATGNGSTTFSSGVTWPDNCSGQVALIISFKEAAGGGATTLAAAAGAYALSGFSAALAGKAIANPGSYALTGTPALFRHSQVATEGNYALTGTAAGITATVNVVLAAGSASYAITGFAAALAGKAIADPGNYALTGSVVAFIRKQTAESGGYALNGTAAGWQFGFVADRGINANYTLTGADASFGIGGNVVLDCASASYALNGTATARWQIKFVAATANYVFTGANVSFGVGVRCAFGSYALTGSEATFEGLEYILPPSQRVFRVGAQPSSFKVAKVAVTASVAQETRTFTVS